MGLMDSLPTVISSYPPPLNHLKTQKLAATKSLCLLSNPKPFSIATCQSSSCSHQAQFPSTPKIPLPLQIHSSNSLQNNLSLLRNIPLFQSLAKLHLSFAIVELSTSLPCFASEAVVSSNQQISDKINLESFLVSIDEFFNRYPFFVAGCTFIWLVVIPLTEEYFRKYKFISAIDAFRKLRDDPDAQLLDIRDRRNLNYLKSPNLKILNKGVVQVDFSEEDQDGFLKKVLRSFGDAENTVVCILDNFDGNSMKVAELLFKNGFKEAYAVKGGVRGQKGWLAVQETLLPPSVHIYPKKKHKASQQPGMNGEIIKQNGDQYEASLSANVLEGQIHHGQCKQVLGSLASHKSWFHIFVSLP
ncbi:Rhodanese-like domain-containing protein chloroplastic-like [Quillaja saponaria]|uniref:Rhodanese-like domain-containing protein chloroplastic-like n=1 Tax=Quillaja saponaria TaxID=32244 RepID=A0AAD7PCL3_QUISA|nr:Rhodanese-like domain-containing protein chloroplastic-like [Quillaja saponaria]